MVEIRLGFSQSRLNQRFPNVVFYVDGAPAGPSINPDPVYYFAGCIDEVEAFNRVLTPTEVHNLFAADIDGKCKATAYLLPWTGFCPGETSVNVQAQICNYSGETETFTCTFVGDPVSASCPAGPPIFNGVSPFTVVVPPGQCLPINLNLGRPANLGAGVGCYHLEVQSLGMPCQHFSLPGRVFATSGLHCFIAAPGDGGPKKMPTHVPTTVGGVLTNSSGASVGLTYRITVLNEALQPDDRMVSLNGMPPGTSATGLLTLPTIGQTALNVIAEFVPPDPGHVYTLQIEESTNGGASYAPLATLGIENVIVGGTLPPLKISRMGTDAKVDWNGMGILQKADAPGGPWTDIPTPANPYLFPMPGVPWKYFRETVP